MYTYSIPAFGIDIRKSPKQLLDLIDNHLEGFDLFVYKKKGAPLTFEAGSRYHATAVTSPVLIGFELFNENGKHVNHAQFKRLSSSEFKPYFESRRAEYLNHLQDMMEAHLESKFAEEGDKEAIEHFINWVEDAPAEFYFIEASA